MDRIVRRLALLLYLAGMVVSARADIPGPYAPLHSPWTSPSQEEVGAYKLQKLIQQEERAWVQGPEEPVSASTCRRNLVLAEFLDEAELKRPPAPTEPLSLSAAVTQPLDVFRVIRATTLGRAILKKFLPKYGTEIKVEMSDAATIRNESQSSALAFYDPTRRLIRIEKNVEVGMVAFVLLHEIVHSLDGDYGNAIQKQATVEGAFEKEMERVTGLANAKHPKYPDRLAKSDLPSEDLQRLVRMKRAMDQMHDIQIFRAERFAYDASYDIWKQLGQIFPKYYKGSQGREVAGKVRINLKGSPVFYDDAHIVSINGLNPAYIQKYKDGKCRPWNGALDSLPK